MRKREIPSKRVDGKAEADTDADTDALASPLCHSNWRLFPPFSYRPPTSLYGSCSLSLLTGLSPKFSWVGNNLKQCQIKCVTPSLTLQKPLHRPLVPFQKCTLSLMAFLMKQTSHLTFPSSLCWDGSVPPAHSLLLEMNYTACHR